MCERLEDILARFGGTRDVSAGAEKTADDYPPPSSASAEMLHYLRGGEARQNEDVFLARLPGGRVFGPGAVLAPDGGSLARDVSADLGKPFGRHWLLTYKKMKPPVRVPGATAVAAVALGMGYGHWLLEELPRLLMLRRECPEEFAVIAHTRPGFAREAFELGAFGWRLLEAGRYAHYACDRLIVPALAGAPGHPAARAVRCLEEFTAPWRAPTSDFGERLYLSREKAGRRRVLNDAELGSRLEACGFRKIHAEELSWREQINAFSHARVIVAPHGAGLANLAFCRRGTRVVEFFNRAYVNPCYWRLAGMKGLDYHPLTTESGAPIAYDPKSSRADILADVPAILSAVTSA